MDYPTFEIDMEVKEKDNKEDFQEQKNLVLPAGSWL